MYFTFCILTIIVGNVLIYNSHAETISTNECIRLMRYTENITAPYSQTVQERKQKLCFSFPFFCTTYETKIVWTNRTEAVEFTKIVRECCLGYEEQNGTCKPICKRDCVHGNCVSPERCLCDAGWTGIDCTEECDSNHYGHDCDEYCLCQNGATCNKMNGTCRCAPGFTGVYCETTCPQGSFGNHCENICRCKNGAACKVHDEGEEYKCLCRPGYIGKFCNMKCPEGTYGESCKNICVCEKNSTEFCNHLNGNCNCLPGYKGEKCEKKCEAGLWGIRCENTCDCGHNVTSNISECNHITGDCLCLAGWYGSKCTDKCPVDRWGKGCLQVCRCLNNSTCDPETGECLCLERSLGSSCSSSCSPCNSQCYCQNIKACDNISRNGTCICSLNENGTACTTDTLGSFDEEDANGTLFLVVAIVIVVFILWTVMIIIRINKSKRKRDSNIEFDESSTATVIENQVLPEFTSKESSTASIIENYVLPKFSNQQFENPVYGDCEVHALSSSKSTAFVTPIRSSLNRPKSAIQLNCESIEKNKLSNALFSSKERKAEKRFSANDVVLYSTSKENPETRDEKSDEVSLYRISIYDDTRSLEEQHYENPNAILKKIIE